MTGLRDSRGEIHELYFYKIKGLCERLMNVASTSSKYKDRAERKQNEVTRLSSELEFVIHDLNWKLIDPYCKNESFELGGDELPVMTDEFIGYSRELNSAKMVEGVIDEKGFISFENFESREQAASIILMHEMINNKELYLDYIKEIQSNPNFSAYEFLVSRPNVVGIRRLDPLEEKFVLNYVSANDGRVAEFVEYLNVTNKLASLNIKTQHETELMETDIKGKSK